MKTHYVQSNFLSGVLDPRAAARIDTQAYNNGMLVGENIVPIHLGGVVRRGGTRFLAQLSNKLVRLSTFPGVVPNGGTAANGLDGDASTLLTTTVPVSTIDPYVVLSADLGGVKSIIYIDVLDIISSGGSSTQFCIQGSFDNVSWVTIASNFRLVDSDVSRSYRRYAPGLAARYLRVAKIGGTDMGANTITISGLNIWADSGKVSECRLFPFEVSTNDRHVIAFTDRTATIFQNDVAVSIIPTPYISSDIASLDATNSAEEMVVVGEKYAPMFILDEDADTDNFQPFLMNFEKIPQVDYNDLLSPVPTSEIQVITFSSDVVGDTFQVSLGTLELGDAQTGAITYAGDGSADERIATANNIATAIQKLFTVRGFAGVTCVRTNAKEYTVTLAGASAAAYTLATVSVVKGTIAGTVTKTQTGTSREEDAWSVTRGYPRTVAFFGGRLFFGGTKSMQQTLFGSAVNNILNFEIVKGLDDEATEITLSGDQGLNAINGLYSGRNLQMFTTGGEFVYQDNPIKPSDAPLVQTQYGCAKIRPVAIDGSTLYVQRNGKSVRDFKFDFAQQAYDSFGVSSLASHLINNIAGMSAWKGSAQDEINLVFVVNGDGTLAVFNTRKEAQVQAWVQWKTFGLYKSVAAVSQDIYFAVKRTIEGFDRLLLEKYDTSLHVDSGVTYSNPTGAPVGIVAALMPHLANGNVTGAVVRVVGDGFVLPDIALTSPNLGQVDLGGEDAKLFELGLNFNPTVTPMPLNTMLPSTGPNFMSKRRVVRFKARVRNTLGLLINGSVIPDREYDRDSLDVAVAVPYSSNVKREVTSGWDDDKDKLITFSQIDPLPMEILGLVVELENSE